jgi:hypothetical protein
LFRIADEPGRINLFCALPCTPTQNNNIKADGWTINLFTRRAKITAGILNTSNFPKKSILRLLFLNKLAMSDPMR